MLIFISGKITGDDNYKAKFDKAQKELESQGHKVLNPTDIVPADIPYNKQMHICLKLIKVADSVYFLEDWGESKGARIEMKKALMLGKRICIEGV